MQPDQVELTLRDYANVVWRRKWIVIAATLITTLIAVIMTAAQTPVYQASTQMLVQPRNAESAFATANQLTFINDRGVQTELAVMGGQQVRDRVAENLGLDRRAPTVQAASRQGTDIVTITVRNTNAQNAATFANAYANAYIDVRREQALEDLASVSAELQNAIVKIEAELDSIDVDDVRQSSLVAQISSFNATLEQLQVDFALQTGGASVVQEASTPSNPVEPTPRRTALLAFVVGLLLGLGAAFLIDYLDDKVRTEDDLEKLTSQPVLSVVPIDPPPDNRPLSLSDPSHFSVEAYRGLRTNLQFLGLDRPLKVIQVTSSLAGEGKTTTACNLAVVLAQAGHKVALVDADLRRPRVHEVFSQFSHGGLTDLLLGAEPKSVVTHVPITGGPRLSVYTAGTVPSNPSEMLSGRRTRALLTEMARHYDYVIVDSAPILPVSDSVALAGAVDGVLIVGHAGRVTNDNVVETVERLERVSAPILGMVLNQAAKDTKTEYSYGGYASIAPIVPDVDDTESNDTDPTTVADTVDA